ncbi:MULTISPECIES: 4Fe-4S binding protein [Clostridia]|uniref:4Fe-4S binding protein n=1 Tax=Clostridia TaxID=186801 RepID=UPI000EA36D90|nr:MULTISPECIES: 4Fe-4S binding protein [Clostridia]NBJ70001.1 polyferredoxin [Roseburia sp. 1XD42-34]RKI77368.1 polyferredoxin [Clostridium sp. 1xD42-85]
MGFLTRWLESLDYDYKILPHCSRYKSPHSTCTECIDHCPKEAIQLQNGKPVIHTADCIDCGKCVASCPVQAVEGFLPKRSIIHKQYIIDSYNTPTLKELLVYYKKGITTIICPEKYRNAAWEEMLEQVNQLLIKLGEEPFTVSEEQLPFPHHESMTRRELLFTWERELKQFAKKMTPAKWRFNHESLDVAKHYPDYQFVYIYLDKSKCTLCKACQMLCPKSCLQINETNFTLVAQRCSNCLLCQDICPEHAISLKKMISPATTEKQPIYTKECSCCENPYQTTNEIQQLCVACQKKQQFSSSIIEQSIDFMKEGSSWQI